MYYTKVTLNDVHGDTKVRLDKEGNNYIIVISSDTANDYGYKKFDTIEEAYEVFERLSRAIVFGEYSYEDRKAMLN